MTKQSSSLPIWHELCANERARQDAKWGITRHDPAMWHLILSEEVGELAEASLKFDGRSVTEMMREAVQVMAVAAAFIEQLAEWETEFPEAKEDQS